MSIPPLNVRTVLETMHARGLICRSAIDNVVAAYGESPIVNRRIILRAFNDRGNMHARNFFATWLDWPPSLTIYLEKRSDQILWGRKYRRLFFSKRTQLSREMHTAAILAYIKEMKKS